jgi:hypothetical protein
LLEDPLQRLALANQAKADAQRYAWTARELKAIEGLVP